MHRRWQLESSSVAALGAAIARQRRVIAFVELGKTDRHDVTHFAVDEHNGCASQFSRQVAVLESEDIVPAIGMKCVDHQRCAKREFDLFAGHADLDLVEHDLVDVITLRHFDPIGLEEAAAVWVAR